MLTYFKSPGSAITPRSDVIYIDAQVERELPLLWLSSPVETEVTWTDVQSSRWLLSF